MASSARLNRRRFISLASVFLSGCVSAPPSKPGRDVTQTEPIPLDTVDPRYAAYLTLVRDKIKSHWLYPCVKSSSTGDCAYNSTRRSLSTRMRQPGREISVGAPPRLLELRVD